MAMGLPLLAQSGLPSKFWVDYFLTLVYLINRLSTPVLLFEILGGDCKLGSKGISVVFY